MTRLRARVAERLKGAQNTYAMLTTFNEIDMTNLMKLRADFKASNCTSGTTVPCITVSMHCTLGIVKPRPSWWICMLARIVEANQIQSRDSDRMAVHAATRATKDQCKSGTLICRCWRCRTCSWRRTA